MTSPKRWISIDMQFVVECAEHGIIDHFPSRAAARHSAIEHRRIAHRGEDFTVGGTWFENIERDESLQMAAADAQEGVDAP